MRLFYITIICLLPLLGKAEVVTITADRPHCPFLFDLSEKPVNRFISLNQETYDKLYDVVLQIGSNIKPGDKLFIQVELGNRTLIKQITDRAFALGAVEVKFIETYNRIPIDFFDEDKRQEDVIKYLKKQFDQVIEEDYTAIHILTSPFKKKAHIEMDVKVSQLKSVALETSKKFDSLRGRAEIAWTLFEAPSAYRGHQIFNSPENFATMQKHLDTLADVLRLNEADPISAWKIHLKKLEQRSEVLTNLDIKKFEIKGGDSNFSVLMPKDYIFRGGRKRTSKGKLFLANIPHEENFSTPVWNKTEGVVHVVKPVKVIDPNKYVEGAWFKFKNGEIVDYGAQNNKSELDLLFEQDPNARFAGEIAFVDKKSIINKTGLIFKSILFDENASSHLAIGKGYSVCIKDGASTPTEQLRSIGCNTALFHIDFMYGTEDLSVWATTKTGEKIQIMKEGLFTELFN